MTRIKNFPAIIPSEDEEQIEFVKYLQARELKHTAIPNHTYNPHRSQQNKNKKLGLNAGLCDVLVALPGIGLAWVEMKRIKKSVTSEEQKEWMRVLNLCPGSEARICKGWREAVAFIEELSPSKYGKALLDSNLF
jgi:hypothetical protein